jgi:pimeloyl-ACP methyl ester carboxylesterase
MRRTQGRSRWVDLDGRTHVLEVAGPVDAPPVVAVHGLGGSHANWLAVAPELARDHRFFAIDLAGHGHTRPDHRGTDVPSNQRLLHRFITDGVGEPVTLLGNSMGGLISVRQAAWHPDTVRDVVLMGPALPVPVSRLTDPVVAGGIAMTGVPYLGSRLLARHRARTTPEEQVAEMLELTCVDPSRVPTDVVDAMVALARERREYVGTELGVEVAARSTVRSLLQRSSVDRALDRVQAPVLILHGEKDRLVPVEASRRAVERRPAWTLRTHPDLGHVVQLEAPAWTVKQIRTWQGSRDPAAAG